MKDNFKSLGITRWLVKNLSAISITTPKPIQSLTIPKILEG